ncbi:MAG TPA: sulfatase-like hydrolase/transferase [Thermoanaerobaculia bacterium]|nr:sulfatase-like hydrolase/transferase [Thermoanaerobaculia bacterium]
MRRFALLLLIAAACSKERATFRGAPVVIISVDTLRSDHLPAYGYEGVATPHIDALRRDAVLFERAYSHCPMTLPSHVSIFTGLLPTEHGVRNNVGYRFDAPKHPTLAATLRGNGYRTGAAVSSYVLRSETGIADGFEAYDDSIPVAAAGAVSEHQRSGYETLKAADAWLSQRANEPFFYFFHIYEPHAPYNPSYDGEIAKADDIVGRLVARLKALGVYEKAVIVFLSDHGEGLWQHGEDQHGILLYREALQVPLFIKLPQSARAGTAVNRPAQLADVAPTILDLLGIAKSDRSLLKDAKRHPIYSETLYPRIHLGWSELRSLIDERWHYIDGPRPELYDLAHDPAEAKDVSAVERRTYAALRQTMATYPSAIESLQVIDPEDAEKLAALGYIGTAKNRTGPLPNPRDEIAHLDEIKLAFQLADQRRYDEAIPVFRRMLQRNPHLSDVWSKLGEILVESGRYPEAIETYKSAIAQAERFSPDLALGLGFAYLKNEQPRETVQHAELALSTNPREANELLARAYAELRQFPEAERHARAAIEAGDRQPTSILLLAEVQRAEGNLNGALQTIDEAERRANDLEVPHLYGIDYLRGDVLARMDRPDEAVVAFRREIEHAPQHMQAYANLALVYFITGKTAEGNAALEQLARANPHRGAYLLAAKTLETVGDQRGAARWRNRAAP